MHATSDNVSITERVADIAVMSDEEKERTRMHDCKTRIIGTSYWSGGVKEVASSVWDPLLRQFLVSLAYKGVALS